MKKHFLIINSKEIIFLFRAVLASLLLLAQINYIFLDYTSSLSEGIIELCEQEENENEEELDDELSCIKQSKEDLLFSIIACSEEVTDFLFQEPFLNLVFPPPEGN